MASCNRSTGGRVERDTESEETTMNETMLKVGLEVREVEIKVGREVRRVRIEREIREFELTINGETRKVLARDVWGDGKAFDNGRGRGTVPLQDG
jgi:hypothetical protein